MSVISKNQAVNDDTVLESDSFAQELTSEQEQKLISANSFINEEGESIFIHPNLKQLSHSSDSTLHGCPRKFELYKLSVKAGDSQEGSIDTNFGHAVGDGIQEYMKYKSKNLAYLTAFRAWKMDPFAEDERSKKKTLWFALLAIDKFIVQWDNEALNHYELVWIDGIPAVELGFKIIFDDGFVYRGKLDALLLEKYSKTFYVYEGKTTGWAQNLEVNYKNSGQHTGYSIVVDRVAQLLNIQDTSSSYTVLTNVYKTKQYEWELLEFQRSYASRALWIRGIMLDIKHVIEYASEQYFPARGEYCNAYGRVCQFFDVCHMGNKTLLAGKRVSQIAVKVDKPEEYQFSFTIDELIESQLARYAQSKGEL